MTVRFVMAMLSYMRPLMSSSDTVLSFHEQPAIETAPSPEEQRQWDVDNLKSMRANMLSVLSQISTHDSSKRDKQPNPLTQSSIRKALQALEAKKAKRSRPIPPKDLTQILAQEGASNLFYYLFEDYAAASPFQEARDTLAELVCPAQTMPYFIFANCLPDPHSVTK